MTTQPNPKLEYWTADRKFGVIVLPKALAEILRHAAAAKGMETGGIALGRYSDCQTWATVDYLSGPPADSQHGRSTFIRGVQGLSAMVARLWKKERRYYLGEWHFHPGASATPSGTDLTQMIAIATDAKYACPEPLLLIIGGDPKGAWELKAFLTFADKTHVELSLQESDPA